MTKTITVDFYRVTMPAGSSSSFEDLVLQIAKRPLVDRASMFRDQPIRLEGVAARKAYLAGDMVKLRMAILPGRAAINEQVQPLPLKPEEGIAEETAFLFDPALRVIAVQRNRFAVSAAATAFYFADLGGLPGPIFFAPVFLPDGLARLKDFKEVSRFEATIAGLDAPSVLTKHPQTQSVSSMTKLAKTVGARNLTVAMSMGRAGGSMGVADIVQAAKELIGFADSTGAHTKKIEITGRGELDDETFVLDLLDYCMTEQQAVFPDGNRRVDFVGRESALAYAYDRRRDELSRMFGPRHGGKSP